MQISITIDPESSKDGTFWPRRSIGTAGHCKMALCIMHCLVSKETALLDKVWVISSNQDVGISDDNGSTLAPFPWPLEVGAFSLTLPLTVTVVQEMPFTFASEDNYTYSCQCPYNSCRTCLGQCCHPSQLWAGVPGTPRKGLLVWVWGLLLLLFLAPDCVAWSAFVKAICNTAGLSSSQIWIFSATAPSSLAS